MKIKVCFHEKEKFCFAFGEQREKIKACFGEVQTIVKTDLDPYTGAYEVVPKAYQNQLLSTENKVMTRNVLVYSIPYATVSNLSGGLTATIGG